MKEEEIQVLIAGFITNGAEDTYNRMKAKSFMSMENKKDLDDMLLDMSETLYKRALEELSDIEKTENESNSLFNIYNTLSFMLKRLAHEVFRKYNRMGDKRDNNRFLRLASYNKNILLIT